MIAHKRKTRKMYCIFFLIQENQEPPKSIPPKNVFGNKVIDYVKMIMCRTDFPLQKHRVRYHTCIRTFNHYFFCLQDVHNCTSKVQSKHSTCLLKRGMSLNFESTVALIFTPVTNLLSFKWIVSIIVQFTSNIKCQSHILSCNNCYGLHPLVTALKKPSISKPTWFLYLPNKFVNQSVVVEDMNTPCRHSNNNRLPFCILKHIQNNHIRRFSFW